jgi:hypothetical protein
VRWTPLVGPWPFTPLTVVEPDISMATISDEEGCSDVACGHIVRGWDEQEFLQKSGASREFYSAEAALQQYSRLCYDSARSHHHRPSSFALDFTHSYPNPFQEYLEIQHSAPDTTSCVFYQAFWAQFHQLVQRKVCPLVVLRIGTLRFGRERPRHVPTALNVIRTKEIRTTFQ